jgi:hypothetical protein
MASHKLTYTVSGVDPFAEQSSAVSREVRAPALGGVKLLFGTYFHREVLARLRVRFETRRGRLWGSLRDGRKARRKGVTAPPMEAKTAHQPLGHGFRNGL